MPILKLHQAGGRGEAAHLITTVELGPGLPIITTSVWINHLTIQNATVITSEFGGLS